MSAQTRANVEIRGASECDSGVVAAVIRKGFEEHTRGDRAARGASLTQEDVAKQMRQRRKFYGVAYIDNQVSGAVGYRRQGRRIIFGPVCVLPEYRRTGIGSALVKWVEGRARAGKYRWIEGVVFRGLRSLKFFYRTLGYRIRRSRKGLVIARKSLR